MSALIFFSIAGERAFIEFQLTI